MTNLHHRRGRSRIVEDIIFPAACYLHLVIIKDAEHCVERDPGNLETTRY